MNSRYSVPTCSIMCRHAWVATHLLAQSLFVTGQAPYLSGCSFGLPMRRASAPQPDLLCMAGSFAARFGYLLATGVSARLGAPFCEELDGSRRALLEACISLREGLARHSPASAFQTT